MKLNCNYIKLREKFKSFFSGLINDSLRELNYLNQALPSSILPLKRDMKIAGPAFTISSVKEVTKDFDSVEIKEKMKFRAKILDQIYAPSVVIWDTNNDNVCAQWGGMMTKSAKSKGCEGAIIDGGIRDTKEILKEKFPVFYRYRTSNGVLGRHRWLNFQVPIKIGGVIIEPGDYIFGDIDGVVVIPKDVISEVLKKSENKIQNESQTQRWIEKGLSAEEIAKKGGIF